MALSLLSHKKIISFPKENQFQSVQTNRLSRSGMALTPKLSELTSFPETEKTYFREFAIKMKDEKIPYHRLPLDYTTQAPLTRNDLIGIAADLANSEFVSDEKKPELLKSWVELNTLLSGIDKILGQMFEEGKESFQIYKKLKVDYSYLHQMKEFIAHQARIIEGYKGIAKDHVAKLVAQRDNVIEAISNYDPKDTYERFVKALKFVAGSLVIGSATLTAAKTELIDFFKSINKVPYLSYIFSVCASVLGGFLFDASAGLRKAYRENRVIDKYAKRISKTQQAELDFVRKTLKLVGHKANREMALAGYLEELQGEVSREYLAAAYIGDMDSLNSIYASLAQASMGKAGIIQKIKSWLGLGDPVQKELEKRLSVEATTSDGLVASNGYPTPKQP
ncbi:hypothetical protein FJZ26_02665 [Candidatus Parvarchaeota archaeon]|nr:hypothetical protein [Candidatus Parvarchaeota archaeon]